jgi:cytochrome b
MSEATRPAPDRISLATVTAGKVYVWDLPTRVFHWLLVSSVLTCLLTGFVAPESWMGVHLASGYVIVALLVFRLIWGVFGPEYSRIASMVAATRRLPEHLRGLLLLRPPHHLGHNPAGSLMIFALFGVLTALAVTGLLVQGGEEKQGPLAGIASYALGHGAKGIHEALVWLLLAMIAGHLAGVLVETWLLRSPLVRAMITGWIPLPFGTPLLDHARTARPAAAAACLAAFTVGSVVALALLSRLPPLGIPAMPMDQAWAAECGDCHQAFHPSLLPRASWAALMGDLGNHFGEDASLPEAKAAQIAAFLDSYAAEAWDTEAARRFAVVSPDDPSRITATPFWVAKHADLAPERFDAAPVQTRANCAACHSDAASGRFDDQAILPPPPTAPGASP